MDFPEDLRYTKEHEWARFDEKKKIATIGITDYAQEKLGDIVHVDLPEERAQVQAEEPFGSVESVKAVSDLYAPLSGEVIEVNDALLESPDMVNEDPFGEAWMIKIKVSDRSAFEELMDAKTYQKFVESEEVEA